MLENVSWAKAWNTLVRFSIPSWVSCHCRDINISQGAIWCRPRSNLQFAGKSNRTSPRSARTQPTWRLMNMTINTHCWMTLSCGVICSTYHYCGKSWLSHSSSIPDSSQLLLWMCIERRKLKLSNSQQCFPSRETGAARAASASKRMRFDPGCEINPFKM